MRNGQPVAAMQIQGRLLGTWTEIIYDGRGYRLAQDKTSATCYRLTDQSGEDLAVVEGGPTICVQISRAIPLPLLLMVILQVGTESPPAPEPTEPMESRP